MKYWYFLTSYWCPLCSKTTIYRERRYDARPEAWEDRHKDFEAYDYCDG